MVHNGGIIFNYILGGAVNDVGDNDTAVHPAMRKAIWQINTFTKPMTHELRDVKNTAPGFNHAAKDEPDWRNAFWGPNLPRLESLKRQLDPDNRLDCWYCVGYSYSSSNTLMASLYIVVLLRTYSFFLNCESEMVF